MAVVLGLLEQHVDEEAAAGLETWPLLLAQLLRLLASILLPALLILEDLSYMPGKCWAVVTAWLPFGTQKTNAFFLTQGSEGVQLAHDR